MTRCHVMTPVTRSTPTRARVWPIDTNDMSQPVIVSPSARPASMTCSDELMANERALRIEIGKISTGQSAPRSSCGGKIKTTQPLRDSLAQIECADTVGSARTHRRASYRVCGPCSNATAATRRGTSLLRTRTSTRLETHTFAPRCDRRDGKATVESHGEGFVEGRPEHLYAEQQNKLPRARGPCRRQGNVGWGEMPWIEAQIDPAGGCGGRRTGDLGIIDIVAGFRGPFPGLFFGFPALKPLSIPARPSLQKSDTKFRVWR